MKTNDTTNTSADDLVLVGLNEIIACPFDAGHRFKLREGLGEATVRTLKERRASAEASLRDAMEKSLEEQVRARIGAEHTRALNEARAEYESERRRLEAKAAAKVQAAEKDAAAEKARRTEEQTKFEKTMAEAVAIARREQAGQLEVLNQRNAELVEEQRASKMREVELEREKQRLAAREVELELETAKKLATEREQIRVTAIAAYTEKAAVREKELIAARESAEGVTAEMRRSLTEKMAAELNLRHQLDDLRAAKDLAVTEAVAKARAELRESLTAQAQDAARTEMAEERERHSLKTAQLEKQLQDALRAADEMKRRVEQRSQQAQGEALELTIEQGLAARFPSDRITEISKGVNGADVLHEIVGIDGKLAGSITWESKNAQSWNPKWLEKLRQDQLANKSEFAVLVTAALPDHVKSFDFIDGIWVCSLSCWAGMATVLRAQVLRLAAARASAVGRDQKADIVYKYLSGPEFRSRVEVIIHTFMGMQDQLQKERRAVTKHWAQREKQIATVIDNVSGMYGDLQGIIGSQTLPEIVALELEAPEPTTTSNN